MIGLPSTFTVVEPSAVSVDCATLGYGIGTGPPGVGVLQTSGKIVVIPLLAAWTTVSLLAFTVAGISSPSAGCRRGEDGGAARLPVRRTPNDHALAARIALPQRRRRPHDRERTARCTAVPDAIGGVPYVDE